MYYSRSTKERILRELKKVGLSDVKWSHIINVFLLIVGLTVTVLFENGWTVCPFLGAVGIIVMINEAADRNGEGVPPLHVYLFFFASVLVWSFAVTVLSVVNIWILLFGVFGSLWYTAVCMRRAKEHDAVLAMRVERQLCIHCATPIDPEYSFCQACGREPNPDSARMKRIRSIMSNRKNSERMRRALTETPQQVARQKERSLQQRLRKR
jgi:hypothetical protein